MGQPLVSVVLPTYNRANTISRSIDSVLNQIYSNLELIVVDDGSSDDTQFIVESINDNRIKYIRNSKSMGAAFARNLGIKHSQGSLIAFQDSDDEWLPDKLSIQVSVLLEADKNVALVYSPMIRVYEETKEEYLFSSPIFYPDTQDFYRKALALGIMGIGIQSCLVRKSALLHVGGFDEKLPRWVDLELFIRLAREYKFQYIDKPLVKYYFSKVSISTNVAAQINASKYIMEKYKNDIGGDPKILAPHLRALANAYIKNKNKEFYKGRECLKKLINTGESTVKDKIKLLISLFGKDAYYFIENAYHKVKFK
jgi:glycosyltransferase involved in cell wall biosynthesis